MILLSLRTLQNSYLKGTYCIVGSYGDIIQMAEALHLVLTGMVTRCKVAK